MVFFCSSRRNAVSRHLSRNESDRDGRRRNSKKTNAIQTTRWGMSCESLAFCVWEKSQCFFVAICSCWLLSCDFKLQGPLLYVCVSEQTHNRIASAMAANKQQTKSYSSRFMRFNFIVFFLQWIDCEANGRVWGLSLELISLWNGLITTTIDLMEAEKKWFVNCRRMTSMWLLPWKWVFRFVLLFFCSSIIIHVSHVRCLKWNNALFTVVKDPQLVDCDGPTWAICVRHERHWAAIRHHNSIRIPISFGLSSAREPKRMHKSWYFDYLIDHRDKRQQIVCRHRACALKMGSIQLNGIHIQNAQDVCLLPFGFMRTQSIRLFRDDLICFFFPFLFHLVGGSAEEEIDVECT